MKSPLRNFLRWGPLVRRMSPAVAGSSTSGLALATGCRRPGPALPARSLMAVPAATCPVMADPAVTDPVAAAPTAHDPGAPPPPANAPAGPHQAAAAPVAPGPVAAAPAVTDSPVAALPQAPA